MMHIVNPERYQKLVTDAEKAEFSGWNFTWLEGRMIQDIPPWDYPTLVKEHLPTVHSLLDMGTGGGELLVSLAPYPRTPMQPKLTHPTRPSPIIALANSMSRCMRLMTMDTSPSAMPSSTW